MFLASISFIGIFLTFSAVFLIYSGVVPQQPPIILTPCEAISAIISENSSASTSNIVLPFSLLGRPALGTTATGIDAFFIKSGTSLFICTGPREQFIPSASTPSPSSIATIASISAPVISFALSSNTFVTIMGKSLFSLAAITAAFVSYESFIVSMTIRSAPFFTPSETTFANAVTASSNGRSPRGLSKRPVGPISSAIYFSPPASRLAKSAQTKAAEIIASTVLSSYLRGLTPKVFVFTTSLPEI